MAGDDGTLTVDVRCGRDDVLAARRAYERAAAAYHAVEEECAALMWREIRDVGLMSRLRSTYEEMTRAWWAWNDTMERWLIDQPPALTPQQIDRYHHEHAS